MNRAALRTEAEHKRVLAQRMRIASGHPLEARILDEYAKLLEAEADDMERRSAAASRRDN